jgi:hypothetical protein
MCTTQPARRLLAASLLLGGFLFAGCGGSDTNTSAPAGDGATESTIATIQGALDTQTGLQPPAAAERPGRSPIDPCALLTQEQVDAAAGEALGRGERSTDPSPLGQQICIWNTQAEASTRMVVLSVVRTEDMDEGLQKGDYSAAKLYEGSKVMGGQAEQVNGVGDEAVRIQDELRAVKGSVYLTVQVRGGPIGTRMPQASNDTLKNLAQSVFDRLNA